MALSLIEITLRYEGRCFCCKGKMMPGEIALWSRGAGIKHKNCDSIYSDHWSEENPFAHIHEHSEDFYEAKAWRDSLDN